ncbi:MAG: SusC/RagA family TonB-linked outer membrane protein [Prevotella sp.]|nr:SusC/RagA family TonB-linked outer membrane protein [Prevotella sp.]
MRNVKQNLGRVLTLAMLLMMTTVAWAQQRITGTVTDSKGEALIGVSVVEAGTTNGATTNIDGRFTLNVKPGARLNVSYIGYNTQTVAARDGMTVTLQEDNQLLDEVVVVGYGTMRRKDVTSSITTVGQEDLNIGVYTDPASLLQGKVAGLSITQTGDPNGTPSITLRGASTLREGAMEPYYVIDGIPGVDISMVAPDDIESIDVLRDASATAIYGSKAANGVIIITTKRGQEGSTNVNYNGYVAFDRISKNLDMMSASQLRAAGGPDFGGNTDWQDEVQRTGIAQSHNVSVNGGHGKTRYSTSLTYMTRDGVIRGSDFKRLNARAFVESAVLKDHLTLSMAVNAHRGQHHGVRTNQEGMSVLDAMNYNSPLQPVKYDDGTWSYVVGENQYANPLSLINEDAGDTRRKFMQYVGKATLKIIDGLTWSNNISYQETQSTYSDYHSSQSQVADFRDGLGYAYRNTYFGDKTSFESYVNYDVTLAKAHKLGLMAGYSWEEDNSNDGFGLQVFDFLTDDLKYYNLYLASQTNGLDGGVESGALSTLRMISFYGRLNYSYNGKYMLQGTLRRDGSSAFGKNHRWATFPSVSVAWNIAEENFLKDSFFDQLKLRAGYGVSGNSFGFNAYSAFETYSSGSWFNYTDPNTGVTTTHRGVTATGNANPDLKWESTAMLNIGLDFAFLNSRINGSIEFYNKKTSDLIWYYPVSRNIYPYDTMTANVGDMKNTGVEFTLNIVPVKTRNFQWQTTINLAHNKNEVTKISNNTYSVDYLDEGNPNINGYSTTNVQRVLEGQPIGTFYTWEWAGYDNNGSSVFYTRDADTGERIKDASGNYVTTSTPEDKDRTITGSAQPKLTYGWNNTFGYKNWSLTAFIQGTIGNKIFNATAAQYHNKGRVASGYNVLSDIDMNDDFGHTPSDRYIEDGSYLRLASLTLGYTFKNLAGWAKSIQLYGTANNLLTLTGYDGIDPEVYMGGLTPGIDYRASRYPHTRTFLVGLKVNFDAGKAEKKAAPAKPFYVTDNAEVDRLNAEVNKLRAENDQLRSRKPEVKTEKEVVKTKEYVTYPHYVNFEVNKTDVTDQETVNLQYVADMIKSVPDKKFSVVGYADKQTGTADKNAQLAKGRAQNVYDVLTKKYGVKASQLTLDSKGGVDTMFLGNSDLSRSVIIAEVK